MENNRHLADEFRNGQFQSILIYFYAYYCCVHVVMKIYLLMIDYISVLLLCFKYVLVPNYDGINNK